MTVSGGDDPRQPQFIKTIPKAGHRFIGPVEERSIGEAATIETREITTVEIEYEEEGANLHPAAALHAFPAGRLTAWRRRRLPLIIATDSPFHLRVEWVSRFGF